MDQKYIETIIKDSQTRDIPCILCGGLSRHRGLFTPKDDAHLPNEPEGKIRSVLYSVCEDHMKSEYAQEIEDILFSAELPKQGVEFH